MTLSWSSINALTKRNLNQIIYISYTFKKRTIKWQNIKRTCDHDVIINMLSIDCEKTRTQQECYHRGNNVWGYGHPSDFEDSLRYLQELRQCKELHIEVNQDNHHVMIVNKQVVKHCDGTFQCTPRHFYLLGLYTISVLVNGFYLPVIHFLKSKTGDTYIRVKLWSTLIWSIFVLSLSQRCWQ